MKKILFLLLSAVLSLSCATSTNNLHLAPFEIRSDNDPFGIAVDEKGIIKFQSEIIGSIKTDGSVRDKDNKLVAILTKDDMLQSKDGKTSFKITKNGQIINGSGNIKGWTENGEFVYGTEETGLTIVPVDKKLFQIEAVVTILFFGME